jgi:hypothetical protein
MNKSEEEFYNKIINEIQSNKNRNEYLLSLYK